MQWFTSRTETSGLLSVNFPSWPALCLERATKLLIESDNSLYAWRSRKWFTSLRLLPIILTTQCRYQLQISRGCPSGWTQYKQAQTFRSYVGCFSNCTSLLGEHFPNLKSSNDLPLVILTISLNSEAAAAIRWGGRNSYMSQTTSFN